LMINYQISMRVVNHKQVVKHLMMLNGKMIHQLNRVMLIEHQKIEYITLIGSEH